VLQTVDADVNQWETKEAADVALAATIAACGLSCFLSSAADAAVTEASAADVEMTAACGLSCFSSSAADAAVTEASADATANQPDNRFS